MSWADVLSGARAKISSVRRALWWWAALITIFVLFGRVAGVRLGLLITELIALTVIGLVVAASIVAGFRERHDRD